MSTLWCFDSPENIAQEICGCDKNVTKLRQEKSHLDGETVLSLGEDIMSCTLCSL